MNERISISLLNIHRNHSDDDHENERASPCRFECNSLSFLRSLLFRIFDTVHAVKGE